MAIGKKNISTDADALLALQEKVIGELFERGSNNIFDISSQVIDGKYINTSGNLASAANFSCTDYIPVISGHFYSISNRTINHSVRCMEKNDGTGTPMKVLSKNGAIYATNFYMPNDDGSEYVNNGIIKIPEGANYIQIGLKSSGSGTNNLMFEYLGEFVPSGFTPKPYEAFTKEYKKLKSSAAPTLTNVATKVLLIGSSHGMNTIGQFPMLAYNSGINVICANAYQGSLTLQQIADYCTNGGNFSGTYKKFYDGVWHDSITVTLLQMLQDEKWDFISIQRAATEDETWTVEQAGYLETILEYITANCYNSPKIVFNSGFADTYTLATRESQQADTTAIWSTAQQVKSDYGIDVIPIAPALQEVRNNDTLAALGSDPSGMLACDSQHLDQGIGMYVTGCICFNFFLKYLGRNVLACNYLPTVADMTPFWYDVEKFTAIDEQYAKEIRKIICKYFASI